jgi:tetratricopeptide (TPR) repeat protein
VYFEVYGGPGAPEKATVIVEVADAPEGAALVKSQGTVGFTSRGKMSRASGQLKFSPAALPPGRYFARVSVDGSDEARAVRGFTVLTGTSAALLADESRALVPRFSLNQFLSEPLMGAVADRLEQDAGDDAAVKNVAQAIQDGTWREMNTVTGNTVVDATVRGLQALSMGQPAEAERAFRDALDADPEFTLALALVGGAWAAVGRDREASRSWRTSLATGIDAPFLYSFVADALLRTGDVKGTREFLSELQEAGAEPSTLARPRALAAAIAGDRRQAATALAPWVDAHPDDLDTAFVLVLALYELKTIDKDAGAAAQFETRAKEYMERGGPRHALVARWLK